MINCHACSFSLRSRPFHRFHAPSFQHGKSLNDARVVHASFPWHFVHFLPRMALPSHASTLRTNLWAFVRSTFVPSSSFEMQLSFRSILVGFPWVSPSVMGPHPDSNPSFVPFDRSSIGDENGKGGWRWVRKEGPWDTQSEPPGVDRIRPSFRKGDRSAWIRGGQSPEVLGSKGGRNRGRIERNVSKGDRVRTPLPKPKP